ncbi:MAG: type II secretion system protein [Magnetococcales bacterium]|nr:type II secretion system protein [Magnetococcales bacterium]
MDSFRGVGMGKRGFTLIEMAILLAVVGTLMLGAITAIRAQANKSKIEKMQSAMQEIEQNLLGFVTINGYLPCPDIDYDGNEDRPCPDPNQFGWLPWRSLGVDPVDVWGHLYSYRVTLAFTDTIALTDVGDMTVNDGNGNLWANNLPVMVVSHGANGRGSFRLYGDGSRMGLGTLGPLEFELDNIKNDVTDPNPDNDDPTVFYQAGDDLLLWIPSNVIFLQAVDSNWL